MEEKLPKINGFFLKEYKGYLTPEGIQIPMKANKLKELYAIRDHHICEGNGKLLEKTQSAIDEFEKKSYIDHMYNLGAIFMELCLEKPAALRRLPVKSILKKCNETYIFKLQEYSEKKLETDLEKDDEFSKYKKALGSYFMEYCLKNPEEAKKKKTKEIAIYCDTLYREKLKQFAILEEEKANRQ